VKKSGKKTLTKNPRLRRLLSNFQQQPALCPAEDAHAQKLLLEAGFELVLARLCKLLCFVKFHIRLRPCVSAIFQACPSRIYGFAQFTAIQFRLHPSCARCQSIDTSI